MPGWHAKTAELVKEGKLFVLGIAPEQHGDRMALFLQWKEMKMPVMLDSYNLLGLKVVPITLLIDEAGVVRYKNPDEKDLKAFLATAPAEIGSAPPAPRPTAVIKGIESENLRDNHNHLSGKMEELKEHIATHPDDARARFQLGVAYRKRHDSTNRQEDDFKNAIASWVAALELDSSNYIWRRRIQQYGPRLDKPYSFYDWVTQARQDLRGRGLEPHPLAAEPSGAEFASPLKGDAPVAANLPVHPDPDGTLPRDFGGVIDLTSVTVPHTSKPKEALRVILTLKPDQRVKQAKWNDEAGISTVHILPPPGWIADPAVVTIAPRAGSLNPLEEERSADFELRMTKEEMDRPACAVCRIDFFYHVCHGKEGVCEYLRRDYSVKIMEHP